VNSQNPGGKQKIDESQDIVGHHKTVDFTFSSDVIDKLAKMIEVTVRSIVLEQVPLIVQEQMAPMKEALQHLADEVSQANNHTVRLNIVEVGLKAVMAACPHCSTEGD
jgi:hypothetical protein